MSDKTMKLYEIHCKGMTYSVTGVIHGKAFVVATNPDEAYKKLRKHLDDKNLGFTSERELEQIILVAEAYDYTDVKIQLFL